MTFPILFPQYAKSSMDSSTKIPKKKLKQLCKNRMLLVVLLYFKLCFQKIESLRGSHRIDKSKNSVKNKRNCPPMFENLLGFKSFECKAFFTKHVELLRRKLSSISSNWSLFPSKWPSKYRFSTEQISRFFLKEVNLRFV